MKERDSYSVVVTALRTHRDALRRFVASRTDAGNIDDVLQTAALRALERAASLRDPDRVLGWLLRLHGNVVTDFGRKSQQDRKLARDYAAEVPLGPPFEQNICDCSMDQIKKLATNYAEIIRLVDLSGLTLARAAEALDISVNNASVRLHRARAALRKQLEQHCGVSTMRACNDCDCTTPGH